jgi:hypothetical protein
MSHQPEALIDLGLAHILKAWRKGERDPFLVLDDQPTDEPCLIRRDCYKMPPGT